jgi:starch synthase
MYSQAYGTVPVVSRVGGLVDTVIDLADDPAHGTGIMIRPTAAGLAEGLERAVALHRNPAALQAVQRRGMRRDFSWRQAALGYERLYQDAL